MFGAIYWLVDEWEAAKRAKETANKETSKKPEAIWIVVRIHKTTKRRYTRKLFRTREAARKYADYQASRSTKYVFGIDRAVWGPEQ